MYYRLAVQKNPTQTWQWRSTPLSSLNALFQYLRLYPVVSQAHLRVFSCTSRQCLEEMLKQENDGQTSNSMSVEQFLCERLLNSQTVMAAIPEKYEEVHQMITSLDTSHTIPLEDHKREIYPPHETEMNPLERRRFALEEGAGGDHDVPYTFVLPTYMPVVLAWTKLLAKVQNGDLQP